MALDESLGRPRPVTVTAPSEPLSFWASFRAARRNVLEVIPAAAYSEPVVRGGTRPGWIMLMDPPLLEHVFKAREPNYPKSTTSLRILQPRVGDNLISSEGPAWRRQRQAMAPMFQQGSLACLAPIMSDAAEASSNRIAAGGETVDMYAEMVAATCDVICDAVLSGRDALDRDTLTDSITAFITRVARVSILDWLNAPKWVPRPAQLIYGRGIGLDEMMGDIVEKRRARGPSDPPDLLDMMIAARDPETQQGLDPMTLRNNLLSLLTAGHETTALALTWALYLVAFDEAVQDRARAVAQDTIGDRAAGASDLPQLGYIGQIVEEALRLYPPAGLLSRKARAADMIGEHAVKQGLTVLIPIYALHRNRRLWDDPDDFDPERFAPRAARSRHRFAFLPFGAGPKACIGRVFAMMEAQIILATLLARFRFRLPPGFVPYPRMFFTVRPGNGMPLQVERL